MSPFFHERGNDGVQRTLVSRNGVRHPGRKLKSCAAILKREAEARRDHACPVACVVTLNQRNDVAFLVDGGRKIVELPCAFNCAVISDGTTWQAA